MVLRKHIFGLKMRKFNLQLLTRAQKLTRVRIVELTFRSSLSHLGSCLSSVDLIDAVYKIKKGQDKFVLSNGHAGKALYAILEKYGKIKDQNISEKLGVHPDRDESLGIYVSTGSLGQGLPIALGMAIANKKENVYCMISDGECAEGSIWEALRITADKKINNLIIIINANGWGAYDPISLNNLVKRFKGFGFYVKKINGHSFKEICEVLKSTFIKPTIIFAETTVEQLPFLKGQDAHYCIMTKDNYINAIRLLNE